MRYLTALGTPSCVRVAAPMNPSKSAKFGSWRTVGRPPEEEAEEASIAAAKAARMRAGMSFKSMTESPLLSNCEPRAGTTRASDGIGRMKDETISSARCCTATRESTRGQRSG